MRVAIIAIESAGGTHGAYREGPEWLRKIVGDERYLMNAGRVTFGSGSPRYDVDDPFDDNKLCELIPHLNASGDVRHCTVRYGHPEDAAGGT